MEMSLSVDVSEPQHEKPKSLPRLFILVAAKSQKREKIVAIGYSYSTR
jgi:hypothetical protein